MSILAFAGYECRVVWWVTKIFDNLGQNLRGFSRLLPLQYPEARILSLWSLESCTTLVSAPTFLLFPLLWMVFHWLNIFLTLQPSVTQSYGQTISKDWTMMSRLIVFDIKKCTICTPSWIPFTWRSDNFFPNFVSCSSSTALIRRSTFSVSESYPLVYRVLHNPGKCSHSFVISSPVNGVLH